MTFGYRSDGAIVDWINTLGIPRYKGQIVVDNLLIGFAMEDIMPVGKEVWARNKKPKLSSGAVCRVGQIEYRMHLQKAVTPWQSAYYNQAIDMVTDSPGSIATLPRPAAGNVGNTTVSPVAVNDTTLSEQWVMECLKVSGGVSTWRIAGSISGTISGSLPSGVWWYSPNRSIGLQIIHGSEPPKQTDRFTFHTTKARTKIGLFMNKYPASASYGEILLLSKVPMKTHLHGKYYI